MFYQLNCKIDTKKFVDYAEEYKNRWFFDHGFELLPMPPLVMKNQPIWDVVKKFRGEPVLIRMPPWTFYNFHIDTNRQCAINSLIAGYNSNSYFGSDVYKNEKLIDQLETVVPLDYELERCYVFNTKHRHGIINRSEIRLTLSIGFKFNSYEEILAYCQEINL